MTFGCIEPFTPLVTEFIRWYGARMYLLDASRGADAITIIRDLVRLERAKAEAFMRWWVKLDRSVIPVVGIFLANAGDPWYDDIKLLWMARSLTIGDAG